MFVRSVASLSRRLVCVAALVVAIAACGSGASPSGEPSDESVSTSVADTAPSPTAVETTVLEPDPDDGADAEEPSTEAESPTATTAATPVTEPHTDSQSGADRPSTGEPDTGPSDGEHDPGEPDAGEPTTAELDTGDDAGCDQLLRDAATDPIPGSEFGRCLVAATTKADTAMVTTTYDDGTGGSGPMSFREPVELHFVLVEGGEILIREDSAWLEMGGSWVAADPTAGFEGEMAFAVTEIYRALTLPAAQTSYFAASEVWELVDEPNETIDGVLTRGFAGSPHFGVVQVEQYEVWVDDDFLPRRIDATVSLAGQRVISRQEFARWGEPVTIPDTPSS